MARGTTGAHDATPHHEVVREIDSAAGASRPSCGHVRPACPIVRRDRSAHLDDGRQRFHPHPPLADARPSVIVRRRVCEGEGVTMWKLAKVCLRALAFGISAYAGALHAQEPLVAYKSLTPALALELAQATLADCQKRGFQAAVAVVDRFGV